MPIILARTAGFCKGVKRAMDIVLGLARKGRMSIYTDGPLIHNPQIISLLEKRGISALEGAPCGSGRVIVIRAHGVSPHRREELKKLGLPIHDATCPDVAKVQANVKKYAIRGYDVVIVGDRGHAEVEGLLGFSGGRGFVVSDLDEARALPEMEKVCVVAQTTQDVRLFGRVKDLVRERSSECIVFDTICRSTKERQRETIHLARRVDAMIVVGGRKSANTARLARICTDEGIATFHVETERDLEKIPLLDFSRIGVTAGASTPNWVIERVVEKAKKIRMSQRRGFTRYGALVAIGMERSCFLTALSALFLYGAVCFLQGVEMRGDLAVAIMACIMCLHLAHRLAGCNLPAHIEKTLMREYYRENKGWLFAGAVISGTVAVSLSALAGAVAFLLFFGLIAGSCSYCIWLTGRQMNGRRDKLLLKWLPVIRVVFISVAWVVVVALVPRLAARLPWTIAAVIACCYVFGLLFIRATLRDIRSINADTLAGRETIPTLVGMGWIKIIIGSIMAAMGVLVLVTPVSYGLRWALSTPLLYLAFYLYLNHRRFVVGGLLCDFLDNGQFLVAGIAVLLWRQFFYS